CACGVCVVYMSMCVDVSVCGVFVECVYSVCAVCVCDVCVCVCVCVSVPPTEVSTPPLTTSRSSFWTTSWTWWCGVTSTSVGSPRRGTSNSSSASANQEAAW